MEAEMNTGSKHSKPLAENLEEIGQSVKKMLKLIENGESLSQKPQLHSPESVGQIEEFYHLYQSLGERYNRLTGEFQKIIPSDFKLQGYYADSKSASTQDSPLLTPHQKLVSHMSGRQAASSSSAGSSDFSLKDGAELSSSSSSDSESESLHSVNVYMTPLNIDAKELHGNVVEFPSLKDRRQVAEEDKADSFLEVGENGSYQELLGNVVKYKQNLRVSNLKLQFSEEEVARLKSELHAQIESAQRDIRMREDDLEMERRQVTELKNYTTELETQVSESNFEIKRLMKEVEASKERIKESDKEIERLKTALANEISEVTNQLQGQLKLAQEDVVTLKARLDSENKQVLKLQEKIAQYKTDLSDQDDEIRRLKVALSDAQENFSWEKAQLQSDMVSLLEKQTLSDDRLKELEDKIKQCETDKMEMKGLHEAQESGMQGEINRLKVEVAQRGSHVEGLNKNFDALKLKYDMLVAEKDEFSAKVNTLIAEAGSRENCIRQTEECLRMLRNEREQLIAGDRDAKKQLDELRVRVKELEKEVERQRTVITDGAEEKREAIRQLCFSLEHYRSGYKELRQAVLGLGFNRRAVTAAV